MHWLVDVPIYIVRAAIEYLPRIEARKVLFGIDAVALGTGSVEDGHARRARESYLSAAGVGKTVRELDPRPAPTAKELAWLGMDSDE